MHEINTAAEAITNAADADANIIFGATINPELEGEVIITVVATGFDASYFANRVLPGSQAGGEAADEQPKKKAKQADKQLAESDVKDLDMTLDDHGDVADFTSESPMPNIWSIDEHADDHDETNDTGAVVSGQAEDELERPSFLRRLKKRRSDTSDDESESTPDK
jgi:hypothetical protein